MKRRPHGGGFSLVEMTVAMAIILAVTGAIFGLIDPAQSVLQSEPERADMQQRVRHAADALFKDLAMAGAGGRNYFAAVLPFRRGAQSPDPPGTFFEDRISIIYVPPSAPETAVSAATDSGSAVLVDRQKGCPPEDPLCGFRSNLPVIIFDETGAYDTFRVAGVQDNPPALLRSGPALSKSYSAGAIVAQIVAATYWVHEDASTNMYHLMKYDGQQTNAPLADHVVALGFEYYGDPAPPWTSYGPKPPEPDIDDPSTPTYGSGENCIFTVDAGTTIVRSDMADLGSAMSSLVRLDRRQLTDGPWCPDPASPHRFDADLLRVRRVRVRLRVRAAPSGRPRVADQEITFDVAPRNLNLHR